MGEFNELMGLKAALIGLLHCLIVSGAFPLLPFGVVAAVRTALKSESLKVLTRVTIWNKTDSEGRAVRQAACPVPAHYMPDDSGFSPTVVEMALAAEAYYIAHLSGEAVTDEDAEVMLAAASVLRNLVSFYASVMPAMAQTGALLDRVVLDWGALRHVRDLKQAAVDAGREVDMVATVRLLQAAWRASGDQCAAESEAPQEWHIDPAALQEDEVACFHAVRCVKHGKVGRGNGPRAAAAKEAGAAASKGMSRSAAITEEVIAACDAAGRAAAVDDYTRVLAFAKRLSNPGAAGGAVGAAAVGATLVHPGPGDKRPSGG